jgi:hypothetical protein
MSANGMEKQMDVFLKQFLLMNILFPLFITVTAVFFYIQGMSTTFILGTVLLLLMGYNIIMAKYGLSLWLDLRKENGSKKLGQKAVFIE